MKAVDFWQHNGIPKNPQAWLYTTAKNLTLNILKRNKLQYQFQENLIKGNAQELDQLLITGEQISDEQLKMMFVCCHPSISEKSQIALMLKILCGFSITEIARAFFTSNETINKRLVRGRKQLRTNKVSFELPKNINGRLSVVLKTIYLLFNEGYSPSQENKVIRYDLCLEAIRLCEILSETDKIVHNSDCNSLLALMYLNASRFKARMNGSNSIIEMNRQDRKDWNQELINKGIQKLNQAIEEDRVSVYLILATISANHCIAQSFDKTDWIEILHLYDSLLELEDTPLTRLNRIVALSKVKGNRKAISELERLKQHTNIDQNHLFHSTLAEFYKLENEIDLAKESYQKAISLAMNDRDVKLLQKKLVEVVPI